MIGGKYKGFVQIREEMKLEFYFIKLINTITAKNILNKEILYQINRNIYLLPTLFPSLKRLDKNMRYHQFMDKLISNKKFI